MAKGCRLVAFDKEVSGPGEAIGDYRPGQCIQRVAYDHGNDDRKQAEAGADGVEPAVGWFAVFLQVKIEEFFVGGEIFSWHGLPRECNSLPSVS